MNENKDFYDEMVPRWSKQQNRVEAFLQDDDDRLWNGMARAETDKSMSVYGLSEPGDSAVPEGHQAFPDIQPLENPNFKLWNDKISPKHYKDIVPGYEYMDVMEHILGFEGTVEHLRGQIFKYLMRFGKKDDRRLESGKIAWYSKRLEDVIDREQRGEFPIKPQFTRPL